MATAGTNPHAFQDWLDNKPLNSGPITDNDAMAVLANCEKRLDEIVEDDNHMSAAKTGVRIHAELTWLKACIDIEGSNTSPEVSKAFRALAKKLMTMAFGLDPDVVKGKE